MNTFQALGLFYTVLCVGCVTAALSIYLVYSIWIGTQRIWRWIQTGQKHEQQMADARVARFGQ